MFNFHIVTWQFPIAITIQHWQTRPDQTTIWDTAWNQDAAAFPHWEEGALFCPLFVEAADTLQAIGKYPYLDMDYGHRDRRLS